MKRPTTFPMTAVTALAAIVIGGSTLPAGAAGTPEQQCEAGKNDAAGKYAACMAKAEKGYVVTGDADRYALAIFKCQGKLIAKWGKLEAKAAAAGATCPSSGERPAIKGFLDGCVTSVATAVAGGSLAVDPITCESDLATCDGDAAACSSDLANCEGDLAASEAALSQCEDYLMTCETVETEPFLTTAQVVCYDDSGVAIACAGTGQDGAYQAGHDPAFTDNGDGTITDRVTGLMWEKLSDDGSIHDFHNEYTLTAGIGKIASLNSAAFAGYNDWRMPNVLELESLVYVGRANPAIQPVFNTGCTPGCTVLTCSCTRNNVYFTSSTYRMYTPAQWKINMTDGDVYAGNKTDTEHVRAVRTAD